MAVFRKASLFCLIHSRPCWARIEPLGDWNLLLFRQNGLCVSERQAKIQAVISKVCGCSWLQRRLFQAALVSSVHTKTSLPQMQLLILLSEKKRLNSFPLNWILGRCICKCNIWSNGARTILIWRLMWPVAGFISIFFLVNFCPFSLFLRALQRSSFRVKHSSMVEVVMHAIPTVNIFKLAVGYVFQGF